ncbi:MAG: hypothetical protein HC904_00410 [Blastochloris sp.]|nr:hypothetical protein [Blastochloris sp.]
MNAVVWTYIVYLALSLFLTVWVAHTLHRNGRVFLVDAFHGNETLADSVNHLLVVGFYLINIGFVSFVLKTGEAITTVQVSFEILSGKMGTVLLVLGLMHFFNLFLFSRLRRRAQLGAVPPPVPPTQRIPVL